MITAARQMLRQTNAGASLTFQSSRLLYLVVRRLSFRRIPRIKRLKGPGHEADTEGNSTLTYASRLPVGSIAKAPPSASDGGASYGAPL
jgi:hypothetical protein